MGQWHIDLTVTRWWSPHMATGIVQRQIPSRGGWVIQHPPLWLEVFCGFGFTVYHLWGSRGNCLLAHTVFH